MPKNTISSGLILFFSTILFFSQNSQAQECEEKYFSCKVGSKGVSLCGAQLGDVFNIMFNIGKETVAEFTYGEKLAVTDYVTGKAVLSSVHFKSKGTVYALTQCDGMECNPDKSSWLSIVKGNKKIKGSGFCEAGSSTGFTNLPFTIDKKGNKVLDKKNFLVNYFSVNKGSKDSFLIENISWSD